MRRSSAALPAPPAPKFCTLLCHTSSHPILVRHPVCACIFMKLTAHLWFWAIFAVFRVHMRVVSTEPCGRSMIGCALLSAIQCKKNHAHPRSGSDVITFLVTKSARDTPIFGPLKRTHTPHRCTGACKTSWTHARNHCASFATLGTGISCVGAPP